MPDVKLHDMKLTDMKFAKHDEYRMKIDYITVQCVFSRIKTT